MQMVLGVNTAVIHTKANAFKKTHILTFDYCMCEALNGHFVNSSSIESNSLASLLTKLKGTCFALN